MTKRQEWNHLPDQIPLGTNPLWSWPPNPIGALMWYRDAWFGITLNWAIIGIAVLSYAFFSPTLDHALVLAPGWIITIALRNLVLTILIAGLLHYWFHTTKSQGDELKFDPRPYPRRGRMFTLDDQIKDNMIWTLASGVPIWTAFEVLIWWSMANGYAPTITWAAHPIWFVAIFFLIPIWESFYFYWMHRLLHTNLFYRFHALHHRNTDIGPWSGLSMHPIEHGFYFGTALIHFAVATHPVHLVAHLMFYALLAITSHSGFEGMKIRNKKRVHLGNFHHQIHHRYFEVNYGTLDVPWDKLFGSFHDGSDAGKAMMKERLKSRTSRK